MRTAAVILAAGCASRFGAPKQLAQLDGTALLQHVVDAALAVPSLQDVIVVLGAQADAIEAGIELGSARVVRCASWRDGLSASLRAGVAALDDDVDCAMVLLGDQPRVTPQAIVMVMDGVAGAGVGAARASYDGVAGHPVALRRSLLRRVPQLSGDTGMRDLLHGPAVRLLEAGHLCDPTDVDTPQDLQGLEASR